MAIAVADRIATSRNRCYELWVMCQFYYRAIKCEHRLTGRTGHGYAANVEIVAK